MAIFAAIGLGLTAMQMVGGARRGAKQSRTNISQYRDQIGNINKSLAELETTASAQMETAEQDFTQDLTMNAKKLGRDKTKLVDALEDANSEFAFSGETEDKMVSLDEDIDRNFDDEKKLRERELDKTLSSIEEFKASETSRLEEERRTLFAGIDSAKNTDSFFENLFG